MFIFYALSPKTWEICTPTEIWIRQRQQQIYFLLENLIKNNCNNLCFHNKSFKITLKPNSYLTSIFHRSPVNQSTPTFSNISLTKTMTNLFLVLNITEKNCNILYLLLKVFHRSSEPNSYLISIFYCGPVILWAPTFSDMSLTQTSTNLFIA